MKTLIHIFTAQSDVYRQCTVSSIQHAGAALSTAHAPDCRWEIHPGTPVLRSRGRHIWGHTVFWLGGGKEDHEGQNAITGMYGLMLVLSVSKVYQCACVLVRLLTLRQQAEAGAVAGFWALHGRGWRKQTRMWKSFGRSG